MDHWNKNRGQCDEPEKTQRFCGSKGAGFGVEVLEFDMAIALPVVIAGGGDGDCLVSQGRAELIHRDDERNVILK